VQRQGGKVRWRNLKTKDPIMAREKLFNLSPFEVAHKQMQVVISQACRELGIDDQAPGQPRPQAVCAQTHTLAGCFDAWKRTWTCSQGTREAREYRWKMLSRVLEPATTLPTLTITRLKEVQAKLREGHQPATVNDIMGKVLRQCLA